MITLDTATHKSKSEIFNILSTCFGSSEADYKFYNLFFDKINFENYMIAKKDNKIVSALYMIDAFIIDQGQKIPVYYIYAAGTLPEYRGHGVMLLLLEFANQKAFEKNKRYTILVPLSIENNKFYQKRGYKNFFKVREVYINKGTIENLFKNKNTDLIELSTDQVQKIRNTCLSNDGDVIWNDTHIEFLKDMLNIVDDKIIYTSNAYAVCMKEEDCVHVIEIVSSQEDYNELLHAIFANWGRCNYKFRIPVNSALFSGMGNIKYFGMIRSTVMNDKIINAENPYLGLPLE